MNLIKRGSRVIKNISLLALISMGASATVQANQAVQTNQTISSNTAREPSNINFSDNDVEVKTIAEGLNKPWGLHYLQNRGFLITERDGGVRFYDSATNTLSLVNKQFVERVYESGQGGMLDVIAHPEFESNYWVYVTFSSGHRFSNATTLARSKLVINAAPANKAAKNKPAKTTIQFEDIKILFRANPMKAATYHFAGRLAFLADKTIVFGVGDGYSYMDDAQDLSSHLGKIIRLNDDGSVPKDNPYVGVKNALPEIYSYGHRNPQGLFYDVEQNVLFSNEHGPKGGDEVNIIKPKLNYGWPEITYGIDYTGFEITPHQTKPGMETPLVNWTPSIAPSSIIVYRGQAFPKLNGLLLNTALKYREIRVVKLGKAQANQAQSKNGKTLIENKSNLSHSNYTLITQKTLLKDKNERLRDIAIDNSGLIYLITDSGKLLQINPK